MYLGARPVLVVLLDDRKRCSEKEDWDQQRADIVDYER